MREICHPHEAPAYIESWGALEVLAIRGDMADLESIGLCRCPN
ncbi:hypothetical protein Ple7327_0509 [Pleurocapsa sp. PCC 7327]|nr:hypothetical protein [Pleurocapsa sp. PCC 7327]AFY75956.1 hypothetical protein Ple7327_0509 [Pleurocapsa sp. PCC 7327]